MIYGKQQEMEIKTIRKRSIQLSLSDADVERLALKAAKGNLSVSQLLENFIGDLVGGTYSNGSDERMMAQDWYERCWFGSYWETSSLLQHLARTDSMEYALGQWDRYEELVRDLQEDCEDLSAEAISDLEKEKDELRCELETLSEEYGGFSAWDEVIRWRDDMMKMKLEEIDE